MRESSADTSERFVRYLLGQLGEAEAVQIEERYFGDDEEFARLEVAADDLADRYVAGRLSPVERSQFERHCLGSRDDRMRVRVAAALRRYRAQLPAEKRVSFFQSLVALVAAQGVGVRFASAAAGLVVVVGASMLAIRTTQLQGELDRVRMDTSGELAATRESAARTLQQEKAQRESLEQRLRDLTTSSFVLVPGTDRASGTELVLGKDASYVRFDLALERPGVSGRYRVTLRTVDRATLWSQDVTPGPGAPSTSLSVNIPALVVGAGQLEVVLQDVDASGVATEMATYGFRIVRRR